MARRLGGGRLHGRLARAGGCAEMGQAVHGVAGGGGAVALAGGTGTGAGAAWAVW